MNPSKKEIKILGLSCFFHDSAAALVIDGKVMAATEEERFSRIKHDNRFPINAINYCLEEGRLRASDLDAVVFYENPRLALERVISAQLSQGEVVLSDWFKIMSPWVNYKLKLPELVGHHFAYKGKILYGHHHRSHAASAFYPSPFEEACVLTIDGVGEWATATLGMGSGNRLSLFSQLTFPDSLGLLYSAFTYFIGFKVNSGEYKLMGLAPYGKPIYKEKILDHIVEVFPDGSIKLNMGYFDFSNPRSMITEKFCDLFEGPPRRPETELTTREMDIAASIQQVTEDIIIGMARHLYHETKADYITLAGGVALNCVANGRLLREGPFKDLWIQPASGDSGGAIGAALDAYYHCFSGKRDLTKEYNTYLGPKFSKNEIEAFIDTFDYPAENLEEEELIQLIAQFLDQGKIIGLFWGRLEFGPRALGGRSILGDPRSSKMQSVLNLKIKFRESFRPFAPAVIEERLKDYFELDRPSPFMLFVAPVKEERCRVTHLANDTPYMKRLMEIRSDIPAVTHLDYSARIQTVTSSSHPRFYRILKAFEKQTGYGVLVNTSFNVRGEPIVCTPEDAYRCFMMTEMDVLVIENYIFLKEKQPSLKQSQSTINLFQYD